MKANMQTYRLGMAASDVAYALDELHHRSRGAVKKQYFTPEVEEACRVVSHLANRIKSDVGDVLTTVPVETWCNTEGKK